MRCEPATEGMRWVRTRFTTALLAPTASTWFGYCTKGWTSTANSTDLSKGCSSGAANGVARRSGVRPPPGIELVGRKAVGELDCRSDTAVRLSANPRSADAEEVDAGENLQPPGGSQV